MNSDRRIFVHTDIVSLGSDAIPLYKRIDSHWWQKCLLYCFAINIVEVSPHKIYGIINDLLTNYSFDQFIINLLNEISLFLACEQRRGRLRGLFPFISCHILPSFILQLLAMEPSLGLISRHRLLLRPSP